MHTLYNLKLKARLVGQLQIYLPNISSRLTKLVFIRGSKSDKIRLSLAAVCPSGPCKNCSLDIQTAGPNQLERPHKISFETSVLSHTLVIKRDNIGHDIEGSL